MSTDDAVDELYGLPLEQFMGARAALVATARASHDSTLAQHLGSLRKPSVAAWAVNQLVRHDPGAVDRLAALSARLHEAQDRLDGELLKDLGRQRSRLVEELTTSAGQASRAAGGTLTPAAAAQVRETFVAALATTAAAEAVASGRLTRALGYAGFGDVDLTDATAGPVRPRLRVLQGEGRGTAADVAGPEDGQTPDEASADQLREAEAVSRTALMAAARAAKTLQGLVSAHESAQHAVDALDEQLAALNEKLKLARRRLDDAAAARAEAEESSGAAELRAREALLALEEAREAGQP